MTSTPGPQWPPCPTCDAVVETIEGFGERAYAYPCGHPVRVISGAGGVMDSLALQKPATP